MKILVALTVQIFTFSIASYSAQNEGLKSLIKKLDDESKIYSYAPMVAGWIQLPVESTTKALETLRTETSDGMDHVVELVYQRSEAGDEQRPWLLIFDTETQLGDEGIAYYYKSDLEGKLLLVVRVSGKIDSEGKRIKGTGKLDYPDIKSDDTKARFQHELDFWLKGAYRKKKAPAKPADSPKSAEKTK